MESSFPDNIHKCPTRGRRKEKNVNAERRNKNSPCRAGWFMNDMVSFQNKVGWIYGFSGGESGKECVLRDIIMRFL